MKPHTLLCALLAFSLTCFGARTWADDDEGGDGDHHCGDRDEQGDNCQGGHIDGSETLVATVALVPTTNAPADAGGVAKLISDNEDGVVTNSFSLCITGLTAGVYDLSVIRKSDSSTVDLGQFTIGMPCQKGGDDEGDDDDEGDEDKNDGDHAGCWAAFIDAGNVQLPSDLDPMDIASIVISDTNGIALLTGDLVTPTAATKIKFTAKIRVHSSSGAVVSTSLNNKAQAQSTAKRTRRTDRFTMIAGGVAPKSTFTVMVNGQAAGTVKSNSKGKILIKKLPANLLLVRSVHVVDENGRTAVHAKF
jgi:hypothetical protein